jgi:RNA polymerase sigma-54 factor
MLREIRALDPRPGLRFASGVADVVMPDVIVTAGAAGGWRVDVNPDAMPRLLIDRNYRAQIDGASDPKVRLFLAECAQTASWLKKSLDQRARTILTVAAEIVRAQSGFFTRGVSGLRPMTLKAVAEAVSVHESTVSRVTANKYVATPRGLFEMKFFFSAAISAADGGDAHSAAAVRDRIRALIAAEPPAKPFSDDHLVRALKAEGVEVARRTVAKYRESLRIPSSVDRRRQALARL